MTIVKRLLMEAAVGEKFAERRDDTDIQTMRQAASIIAELLEAAKWALDTLDAIGAAGVNPNVYCSRDLRAAIANAEKTL
jgi:hypothetical protein